MGNIIGLTFPAPAEKFVCPHCGKVYQRADTLEKHIKEKHPDAGAAGTDPGQAANSGQGQE